MRNKKVLALLIPAHDESLVIENTIESAICAGMKVEDIYVVDDNSSDNTSRLARQILPRQNVARVRRSGKGLAIKKAGKKFELSNKYRWIHVADADGGFAKNYFRVMRRDLRVNNAAATGYIKSSPGRIVGQYRVLEYTIGMEIHRRIQSMFNVIPIIPGPTSIFRWDVFDMVDFDTDTLTEDFDVTMQIYRRNLGTIQFIPKAVAYTQDPYSLKDFINQITRWNRGVLQVMLKHKSLRSVRTVDVYLKYQIIQNILFLVNFFVWIPYLAINKYGMAAPAVAFLYDIAITFVFTLFSAMRVKRYDIIGAFPIIYAFRWISLWVFCKAFLEVIFLRKFRSAGGEWQSGGEKRYKLGEV